MLFLFFRSLRTGWLEYLLGACVVAFVIATVITLRSLTTSAEDKIHDLAHRLGKNMLVVPEDTDLSDFYAMRYGSAGMPDSYPDRIRSSALSRNISFIQSRLYGNMDIKGVPLVIVGEKNFSRGSVFSPVQSGKVILGDIASSGLGLRQHEQMEIDGLKFTVDRVINKPPDGLETGVFTSLDGVQNILGRPGEINAMRLGGCWCRIDIPALAGDVEQLLPGTKAITVAGMIKAQKGTVTVMKRYSLVINAAAVLLIAGIVIVLISSQVRRESREIGLLLATGAPPRLITLLFIIRAGLVGAAGGLAGYSLGFPLTEHVASRLMGASLSVPQGLFMLIIPLSVMVSVTSAFFPAWRAAELDPTVVLREI